MSDELKQSNEADIPHSARIWNYWMGGEDNTEIDRIVGDAGIAIFPGVTDMARQSRQFLFRAVRYLAGEAGIRQFLDIGTGLPVMQNTHEVARSVAPESKIVYVDNDPLVLAQGRKALESTGAEGAAVYIDADYNNPEQIISGARDLLDFSQPVAVMFMGVLGHAGSYENMRRIVSSFMDAVPSGSYLVAYDGTTDDDGYVKLCEEYAKSGGVPYTPRTRQQLEGSFEALELVAPGYVSLTQWRPDGVEEGTPKEIGAYCGVGRKP